MSGQARESQGGIEPIPVLRQGTVQEITVDSGETVCFVAIGPAPIAGSGTARFRIGADYETYMAINPGEKVAASGSTTGGTSNAVGAGVTVVRLFYDATGGKLEVMECG